MVMLTIKSKTETPNARLRLLRTGGTGDTTLGSKMGVASSLTNKLSKTMNLNRQSPHFAQGRRGYSFF